LIVCVDLKNLYETFTDSIIPIRKESECDGKNDSSLRLRDHPGVKRNEYS
jgi:hypothetical protein